TYGLVFAFREQVIQQLQHAARAAVERDLRQRQVTLAGAGALGDRGLTIDYPQTTQSRVQSHQFLAGSPWIGALRLSGARRRPLKSRIRRFSFFTSLPQSGSGAERRIAIGREQERIGCNPEPPPEHSDDEVEEGARITTRKQYREPGNNDAQECRDAEEPQDDVVRDRQEPLDERQPAIQLLLRIRVGNLNVHGLLVVRRGILVA